MKISMTRTIQGSLDGATVRELLEGVDYDTIPGPRGDRLALSHIRKGHAVLAATDSGATPAPAAPAAPERAEAPSAPTLPAKLKAPRRTRPK